MALTGLGLAEMVAVFSVLYGSVCGTLCIMMQRIRKTRYINADDVPMAPQQTQTTSRLREEEGDIESD